MIPNSERNSYPMQHDNLQHQSFTLLYCTSSKAKPHMSEGRLRLVRHVNAKKPLYFVRDAVGGDRVACSTATSLHINPQLLNFSTPTFPSPIHPHTTTRQPVNTATSLIMVLGKRTRSSSDEGTNCISSPSGLKICTDP